MAIFHGHVIFYRLHQGELAHLQNPSTSTTPDHITGGSQVDFPATLAKVIELDDGKIYRKALYLMVKTNGFPVDFPNKTNPLTKGRYMEIYRTNSK